MKPTKNSPIKLGKTRDLRYTKSPRIQWTSTRRRLRQRHNIGMNALDILKRSWIINMVECTFMVLTAWPKRLSQNWKRRYGKSIQGKSGICLDKTFPTVSWQNISSIGGRVENFNSIIWSDKYVSTLKHWGTNLWNYRKCEKKNSIKLRTK